LGPLARRLDARALREAQDDAGARLGRGERAGMRIGLDRALAPLRQAPVRGALRARDPLCARKLHGLADHCGELGAPGAELQELLRVLLDLPAQGPRALPRRA